MREWADVYLESIDDRVLVERNALFFVPSALHLMSKFGITKNNIATYAMNLPGKRLAGRQAVTRVADCKPVVYESASGFVKVFNGYCEREGIAAELATRHIVACVFRIENLNGLIEKASISKIDLQRQTGIPAAVIESAINNFRIQLGDALKIFDFLSKLVSTMPEIHEFIALSEKSGRTSVKKLDDNNYVYKRENLAWAPPSGHPWALEKGQL